MIPPTSQNPKEFEKLLKIYKNQEYERVLEIGTHEGGTLFHWLQNAALGSMVGSIDNQGIINETMANKWAAPRVTVRCLRADSSSQEAIKWVEINFGWLDWLFIDGGHSYEQVKADFENYSPLVVGGGIIAFHDILPHEPDTEQPCEVDKLWQEIKDDYFHMEIIEPHSEWKIGPGIGIIIK